MKPLLTLKARLSYLPWVLLVVEVVEVYWASIVVSDMVELNLNTELDGYLYPRLTRLSNSPIKFVRTGVHRKSETHPNRHVRWYQSGIWWGFISTTDILLFAPTHFFVTSHLGNLQPFRIQERKSLVRCCLGICKLIWALALVIQELCLIVTHMEK